MISKKQDKKVTCIQNKCERAVYKSDKCVLHCNKKSFAQADSQGCFAEEIIDYILEQLLGGPCCPSELLTFNGENSEESTAKFNLKSYKELSLKNDQKNYLKDQIFDYTSQVKIKNISVCGIHFPKSMGHSLRHYSYVFSRIKEVDFDNCFFYGDDWKILSGWISFKKCIFFKKWKLTDYKAALNVLYQGCHFKKKVECKGTKNGVSDDFLSSPQFDEKCTFDDGIELKNIIVKANIFSVISQPENSSNLSGFGAMKGLFEFTDCTFSTDQEIFLANVEEASFLLKRCKFEKKFKIRGLEYTEGYDYQQSNKTALKSLEFNSCQIANNDDSYLRVSFLKNCDFSFNNFKNQPSSELNIGDCHFKSFQLTNFRNLGKFKLFKINVAKGESGSNISNPCFQIDNTSIGNTDFQSIDLNSFSEVFMFDNIFSEIDYTNVIWSKSIEVKQLKDDDADDEIAKKRDSYRTLKNVALKNNDRPQALEFYAKEMESHYEITKWGSQFGDKLTLWFNQFTNQFGMSWAWPLGYLVVSSILLYIGLYLLLLNNSSGYLMLPPWENYWTFLNPMHKVEFMFPKYWNGWTYFIDLLFRVIQALLIYQTIQAFRKFTRAL